MPRSAVGKLDVAYISVVSVYRREVSGIRLKMRCLVARFVIARDER